MLGLTYDDVLLLPGASTCCRTEVDTTSPAVAQRSSVNVPLLSAAMDNVTEARMAIAMARQGGVGVLHRNLSIEDQANQVDLVKRSESGMVTDPVTVGPDATLGEATRSAPSTGSAACRSPTSAAGCWASSPTATWPSSPTAAAQVREIMTPMPLITGQVGITGEDASALLRRHKIEKLPLVDAEGRLKGLITVKDFVKAEKYPEAAKDAEGRLLVGAAVGAGADSLRAGRRRWSRPAWTSWSWTPRTATTATRWMDGEDQVGRRTST